MPVENIGKHVNSKTTYYTIRFYQIKMTTGRELFLK